MKDLAYIKFPDFKNYAKGSAVAANIGTIECKPKRMIIVSEEQIKAIEEADVKYSHVTLEDLADK